MMDVSLLIKLLSALNIAVIEQSEDGSFQILGAPTDWFKHLLNCVKLDGKSFTIEDELSFLGSFVTDAAEFWRLKQAGRILWSGPWEEKLESGEYAILEAGALYLESRNILIIKLFGHHVLLSGL